MNDTINDIIETLKICDDKYFCGETSELTDTEYDLLKKQAFKLDPLNDYFNKVGSDERGGKVKLPYTLGSLNQIYDEDCHKWNDIGPIVAMHKLDGVSVLLIYRNNKLSIAYSRGNGIEGQDLTRHIKHIPNIPLTTNVDYLAVRAEIIMNNETFNEKYSSTFKNPRNMVAGIVNRKESDSSLTDMKIIAYEIIDSKGIIFNTKEESLQELKKLNFEVVNYTILDSKNLSATYLKQNVIDAKSISPYELDGIVLSINDLKTTTLQPTINSNSLNPWHTVKYKYIDDNSILETFVTNVIWEVSKSAYLKPVIEILPVKLFGTTVKQATGFNAAFIRDNNIGKGTKIKITKSGQTIPYICEVITPSTKADLPLEYEWEFNDNGVEAVLKDVNHPTVIFKKILDFFQTYDIELLKEANLKKIWNYLSDKTNYSDIIKTICDLSEIEWINIIGLNGEKIYKSLHLRLKNSTYETFLGSCDFFGIGFGVRRAKLLLSGLDDPINVFNLSIDEIIEKDGFDIKTATNVYNGLKSAKKLHDELIEMDILAFTKNIKTTELKNYNIVMTGFRDKNLQYKIESMGGKVSTSVSNKTTHLLCYDTDSQSTKMKKAKDFGVNIMTPEDFKIKYKI